MQITTLGPRGFKTTLAAASATFTALQDRSAMIRDIRIVKPSASDDWTITIQQTQKMVFPINTTGNNQFLGKATSSSVYGRSFFRHCRQFLGIDPSFPLPQGQQLSIASVSGATADITIEYEERSIGDVREDQLNGQAATRNVLPIFLIPPSYSQASGLVVKDFVGQKAPAGFPKLYGDVNIPANYTLSVLALMLEGGARNMYASSTDHLSNTQQFTAIYSGQQLFSRDSNGGVPMVGVAAAAGSANDVYALDVGPYPALQIVREAEQGVLPVPLVLRGGSEIRFQHSVTGDGGAGADYAAFFCALIVDAQFSYISPV